MRPQLPHCRTSRGNADQARTQPQETTGAGCQANPRPSSSQRGTISLDIPFYRNYLSSRTRLEACTTFVHRGLPWPKNPWGRSLNSMAAATGNIMAEDLFPAVAAQPLNSNPRGLKKIRRCYALTRTDAGRLRHTKSICWRVRLRPPAFFYVSTFRILR